jgi:hypothetical protein
MNTKVKLAVDDRDLLLVRVKELHQQLRQAKPTALAANTGASFLPAGSGKGTFYLPYWSSEITLTYPEFVGRDGHTGKLLSTLDQALLAYYFTLSDGSPEKGDWISFSELPDGKFYNRAYQGYTGNQLTKRIGRDEDGFVRAAELIKGRIPILSESLGDIAYRFEVLPHVSLLAVCWIGDEDFPPSYRILFDVTVSHHLSTDACAIVGSSLTHRLLKCYGQMRRH